MDARKIPNQHPALKITGENAGNPERDDSMRTAVRQSKPRYRHGPDEKLPLQRSLRGRSKKTWNAAVSRMRALQEETVVGALRRGEAGLI